MKSSKKKSLSHDIPDNYTCNFIRKAKNFSFRNRPETFSRIKNVHRRIAFCDYIFFLDKNKIKACINAVAREISINICKRCAIFTIFLFRLYFFFMKRWTWSANRGVTGWFENLQEMNIGAIFYLSWNFQVIFWFQRKFEVFINKSSSFHNTKVVKTCN